LHSDKTGRFLFRFDQAGAQNQNKLERHGSLEEAGSNHSRASLVF
jgi:hypothetical protein